MAEFSSNTGERKLVIVPLEVEHDFLIKYENFMFAMADKPIFCNSLNSFRKNLTIDLI